VRAFWVFAAGLVCALCALVSAVWVAASMPTSEASALRDARGVLQEDAAATRPLLALSCARDIQVERLLLELVAGGGEDDARDIESLLELTLGGQVDLYVARGRKLEALADAPVRSRALLERAERQRLIEDESLPTMLDACRREERGVSLWVARSTSAPRLLEAHDLSALSITFGRTGETSLPHAFSLPTAAGARLFLRATQQAPSRPVWLVPALLCALLAFLLGALLALAFLRRAPVEEAVLATLEEATERVAQGDLSSTIQLRVGGRADQTFRSFDRMTAELRETRAKLAEAERAAAWQDMAQRVAHEIKNPLSPIKMGLETLRKAHAKNSDLFQEIFDESTHAMLEEVQRIEHIVREFSDFARLPKARPGALDLGELCRELAKLYVPAEVALDLHTDRETAAHADREQVSQVIVNLLKNAIDAARSVDEPRIAVSVTRDGDALVLAVDDNGAGVPERDRARIFEPYVTGKPQGTGLGLSIVRRIVHDHGGSVEVTTSALGGARFVVRLPQSVSMP
jgi:two-component system nitrogen regulation sensor histidine kinase NtrY